jgi:hypothetical protein
MEDGGWRMEDGGWRMEDGGWRMEDVEDGGCGGWRTWRMERLILYWVYKTFGKW